MCEREGVRVSLFVLSLSLSRWFYLFHIRGDEPGEVGPYWREGEREREGESESVSE